MNVQELAQMPLFSGSLVFCGLVAAYGITVLIRWALGRTSIWAANSVASPEELETIDFRDRFYRQFETFLRHISDLETLGQVIPKVLNDQSWRSLLTFKDDLTRANDQLTQFLDNDDLERSRPLARFLCGARVQAPTIKGLPEDFKLDTIVSWQSESLKLIQRIAAKFEDGAANLNASGESSLPDDFIDTFKVLRRRIMQDEKRYQKQK
jgi:hypothetical protein